MSEATEWELAVTQFVKTVDELAELLVRELLELRQRVELLEQRGPPIVSPHKFFPGDPMHICGLCGIYAGVHP